MESGREPESPHAPPSRKRVRFSGGVLKTKTKMASLWIFRPQGILHVCPFRRVYLFMSRLALLVWLAAGTAFCADPGLMRILKAVEDRYNHAQTLQIAFSEG